MMGSNFCNHKNEKMSPLCLLGDFCWKWWAQLSLSSSDVSEVSYCSTSSGWANVEGNAQDHQADRSSNAAPMGDIWNGLCSLATPGMCYVRSRQKDGQICFIDKPEEWIMILGGKSASHTQAIPLLIPLPFYWQTYAIAKPGEMAGKWVLFVEVYELSPFKIAEKWKACKSWQVKCKQEIQVAGKKY